MSGNSFGNIFRITTFGESHGKAIGVVIDGCPSGITLDEDFLQAELDRRKPGQSKITTQRKEADLFEVLSGVFAGKTTGTPLAFLIKNEDQRSGDYRHVADRYRPSHADYTYDLKYGFRDYRGGGRSSARETAARVLGGAVAKLFLQTLGTEVRAFVSQIGDLKIGDDYRQFDFNRIEENIVRCPDPQLAEKMITLVDSIRKEGDSIGGVITCVARNVQAGIGEPVFDKLSAELAKAMLSINAVKGFEYGSGFAGVRLKGSEHNDLFVKDEQGKIRTLTNFSGGIQGGITNGEDIYFRTAFKPVATIMKAQASLDQDGNPVEVTGRGRHDPCVVPRAVPIVEAMTALVLADYYLLWRAYQ